MAKARKSRPIPLKMNLNIKKANLLEAGFLSHILLAEEVPENYFFWSFLP